MLTCVDEDIRVPDIALHRFAAEHALCLAILGGYVTSFFLPAIGSAVGAGVFLWGLLLNAMGVGIPAYFAWLANPLLWYGLIALCCRKYAKARWSGLAATLLAGSFPLYPGSLHDCNIGYWLWLACMAALAISAQVLLLLEPVRNERFVSSRRRPTNLSQLAFRRAHSARSPLQ